MRSLEVPKRTAEAYARAIQLGTSRDVFENLLSGIATERRRLQQRKSNLEALLSAPPEDDPQDVARIASAYARNILEMLDTEMLPPLEKNRNLRRVLREIKPIAGGFRIVARPFTQVVHHDPPVTGIVMPVR